MSDPKVLEKIVVGVDGSAESLAALRWAVDHARHTGAPVEAITAWRPMPRGGFAPDLGNGDYNGEARQILDHAVKETAPEAPEVSIQSRVAEGHPARVLTESARPADTLVLGSRGHGGFAGLVLGSVTDYCVHHAPCTVVVVRPQESRDE